MSPFSGPEKTEVIYGLENFVKWELEAFLDVKERIDACFDSTGPSALIASEPIWREAKELAMSGIKCSFVKR
jgi:hypothetical protein